MVSDGVLDLAIAVSRNVLIGGGAALIAAALGLYVFLAGASKPDYSQFSRGAMTKLSVLEDPPAQPDRVLRDSEGRARRLGEFRGQVVLVNLWATWCAPCVAELPTLGALDRAYEGRGFRVIPVSLDGEAEAVQSRARLDELSGGGLPYLLDPTRRIQFDVQARGLPVSILYDRQGREVARVSGDVDWTSADARALIDFALEHR